MSLQGLKSRLRDLLRREDGIALPVALFGMIASVSLAGAAVVATVDVQQGSQRDSEAKRAIAAADAAANIARVRQTRFGYVLNQYFPCLAMNAEGELERGVAAGGAEASTWCAPIEGKVGDATYEYQVSPVGTACGDYELCVVATGRAGDVSRRIEVTFDRSGSSTNESEQFFDEKVQEERQTKLELIEAELNGEKERIEELEEKLKIEKEEKEKYVFTEGFIGREGIVLSGNADIRTGLGTNGHLETTGNATICDDIRVGVGKKWVKTGNASQCSGFQFTQGNRELMPVSSFMPTDIATKNSNIRITTCTKTSPTKTPAGCQADTLSGDTWKTNSPFNPTTRRLSLSGNSTLTVGGGDYFICGIDFSGNSKLIMADGARVRFFFDKPENCGYNGNQLNISGNNEISATGYQPGQAQYEMPGFYFVGSPTIASQINLSGNQSTTNEMVIYGPDTQINISGNATWKGIIVGKRIAMSGNGKVMQDTGYVPPPELNPGSSEETGGPGSGGGDWEFESVEEIEERLEELKEEIKEEEERELERKNTAQVRFTPQAYFECSGAVASGAAPNSGC